MSRKEEIEQLLIKHKGKATIYADEDIFDNINRKGLFNLVESNLDYLRNCFDIEFKFGYFSKRYEIRFNDNYLKENIHIAKENRDFAYELYRNYVATAKDIKEREQRLDNFRRGVW